MLNSASVDCDPCGPTTNHGGVQGMCPPGFHIPSDLEWSQYEWCWTKPSSRRCKLSYEYFEIFPNYIWVSWLYHSRRWSRRQDESYLRQQPRLGRHQYQWFCSIAGGFFNIAAQPAVYQSLGSQAYFWTATNNSGSVYPIMVVLWSGYNQVLQEGTDESFAQSMRCLKD